jgi:predicted porin
MKKTLIALASVAALGAAHADVTLYGVIDMGVASANNGLSSDVNNPSNLNFYPSTAQSGTTGRATSMTNGAMQASRWGLKGSEDLGSGMKANFVLESGLDIAGGVNPNDHALLSSNNGKTVYGAGDSSLNGGMFDRQSTVGLSGDFGSIDAGYQLNLQGVALGSYDALGAGYVSPLGTYGGLTGMGSSFTGRASNSFKYQTSMGSTNLRAFYALGGASGNAGAGSQIGLQVEGALTPTLNVTLVAQKMNDNMAFAAGNTAGANDLKVTYYNSTSASLMGNWQATPKLKVFAGYESIVQSNPSNGAYDATITQVQGVPILNSTAYSGYNIAAYDTNLTTTISWLGAKYDLDQNSRILASYYLKTVSAYTADDTSAGAAHLFSSNHQNIYAVAYDQDLSKQTDVYVWATLNQFDSQGGSAASTTVPQSQWGTLSGLSITTFGAGLRVKF